MTDPEFLKAQASTDEIEIAVTGRKSHRSISTPVWFVHEDGKLYFLPVSGSDTNWYKNVLAKANVQLSTKGRNHFITATPVSDPSKVNEVVEKFRSKYGANEIEKYYSKLDVALEVRA